MRLAIDLYPFHGVSMGETAAPDLSGECGGGKNPPHISRRKDHARRLGAEEKALRTLPQCLNWKLCNVLRSKYFFQFDPLLVETEQLHSVRWRVSTVFRGGIT